jgi:hypothetical protein
MKACPNCSKRVNGNFTYCNACGSRLDGEKTGDFTTDYLNVFHVDDEYVYLFSVRGRQVVLKANSIMELKEFVAIKRFPWREPEKSLLAHDTSLTKPVNEDYGIIGVSTLERNPAYSNLDKMFR